MNRPESTGFGRARHGGAKEDLLTDIQSAVVSLKEQLNGQAKKLGRTFEFLQAAIELSDDWMELDDLETLKNRICAVEASLNKELGEVRERFGNRILDVYTCINRRQNSRGYVLHQIKPVHSSKTRAGIKGIAPNVEPMADVVFVHGLDGSAFDTWQFDPRRPFDSWPFWLADELKHVNIWTLSYPASSRDRDGQQGLALVTVAKGSLEALRESKLGDRPLVFVAHSLGGLVVKKMAHLSCTEVHASREHCFFKDNLRGVVFLATPHGGSYLGTLAHAFSYFYRRTATIDSLRKNDASIDEVGTWFRKYAHDQELKVHVHRETVKRSALKVLKFFVVEPTSADPGIYHAKLFDAAGKDHVTICKCGSSREPVYEKTRDMILAVAPKPATFPTAPSADDIAI